MTLAEKVSVITNGIFLIVLLFGGVKFYYVLYEYPPHRHTERGESETLTTEGVLFPRGMRNGS